MRHRCSHLHLLLLFARCSAIIAADISSVAKAIYDLPTPPQVVLFATGGGIQASTYLLGTPGASRSVLDVQMPYSRSSLRQLLGGRDPHKYVSADVARDLAAAAFERARALRDVENAQSAPAIGVGCTAALRSEPMKRGAHRCFVAVRTEAGTHEVALTLAKGARSRLLEDAVVSHVAVLALAKACGVGLSAEQAGSWRLPPDNAEGEYKQAVAEERLVES